MQQNCTELLHISKHIPDHHNERMRPIARPHHLNATLWGIVFRPYTPPIQQNPTKKHKRNKKDLLFMYKPIYIGSDRAYYIFEAQT